MPSLSSFFPTVKPGKSRSIRNAVIPLRSEEHTSELQSRSDLVCRLLLEKKKNKHDFTFSFEPQIVLLLNGSNDAGKTPLVNCITDLYMPPLDREFCDDTRITGDQHATL